MPSNRPRSTPPTPPAPFFPIHHISDGDIKAATAAAAGHRGLITWTRIINVTFFPPFQVKESHTRDFALPMSHCVLVYITIVPSLWRCVLCLSKRFNVGFQNDFTQGCKFKQNSDWNLLPFTGTDVYCAQVRNSHARCTRLQHLGSVTDSYLPSRRHQHSLCRAFKCPYCS